MAPQTDGDELLAAWRALAGGATATGWRTIPVAPGNPCRLLAGRHFPGNEEALLVGFGSGSVPVALHLPQGRGFLVSKEDLGAEGGHHEWVALCRQQAGRLDLFAMMARDIVATLGAASGSADKKLFQVFLSRIRAWQDFMGRGSDLVLGPEAEIGLFGELEVLSDLLAAGVPATVALDGWQGPLEGIHDFVLGAGAIEVKSTLSATGFAATIGSLEQLDDSLVQPLFIAGIRLALHGTGRALTDKVAMLREALSQDPAALAMLNSRLVHAGFLDESGEHYTRRFARVASRVFAVRDAFPRLTRSNVPLEIRQAFYEIDLDTIAAEELPIGTVLGQLGVTSTWT